MNERCGWFFAVVYAVIGFLTFAYIHEINHLRDDDRVMGSILGGLVWPVYWAGTGSLEIVRALNKPAPEFKCYDHNGITVPFRQKGNNVYECFMQ